MITYNCSFCQTVFNTKYPSRHTRQYCSKQCCLLGKAPKLSNNCRVCSKPIVSDLRYCGKECRTIAVNARKQERENLPKKQYKLSDFAMKNHKDRVTKRCKNLKLKGIDYKGGKCQCCGYNKYPGALDFHHIDPSKKEMGIAQMRRSWENVRPELDKCILVCSNCHREIHAGVTNIPIKLQEIN